MFDPNTDPLGISLMQRGRQHREQFEAEQQAQNPFYSLHKPINTLPDSRWGGLFQAMEEAGVDNLADSSVGVKRGMWSPASQPDTGLELSNPWSLGGPQASGWRGQREQDAFMKNRAVSGLKRAGGTYAR